MADKQFDPQKFIDREFEQELFEELLHLKDQARILAIRDAGGMGKSQLLQKFQYRCRTAGRPRIPVSLVDLGQLPNQSPLSLVQQIEKELSTFSLHFPTFTRLETARRAYDFSTISGTVDLRGADLQESNLNVAGVMTHIDHAESVTVHTATATFTDEQQAMAQTRCVQAFLTELSNHCQQRSVVLIFDGYEYVKPDLQRWLLDHVLEPHCFDFEKRPPQLIFVIAGRELPNFEQHWSPAECGTTVKSVRALGRWTIAHVEECLRVHGFCYTERQLRLFCDMVENNLPPSHIVQAMELILPNLNK